MTKTETETIEYKKSLAELKEGIISIVAILNKHRHGELWFGIRNDGKIRLNGPYFTAFGS